KLIETTGTISKKETLGSLEEEFCNGALVLETQFPFPGYYHKTIPDSGSLNPRSLFLLTRDSHSDEQIVRAYHNAKKLFRKVFHATPGEVGYMNQIAPCIRIKYMEDYNDLPELTEHFKSIGIQFQKYRKTEPFESIIKVRKYFELKTLSQGTYLDLKDPRIYYFVIPAELPWEQFETMVVNIKRNTEENKFDAALGTLYMRDCLVDLVRIFDEEISLSKAGRLKEKFIQEIQKNKKL
ncbi:MAG: hypothetical protein JXA03_08700, partial [Bacteroidales bacterium]|nr:hypothetical protein [Bacteroidales bacterium]